MSTWQDVDRALDPSPVRALTGDFETVATQFQGFEQSATSVVAGFVNLTGGDTTIFEGKAAQAFIEALGAIADDMRDLPALAGSVAVIFRDHAGDLTGLQTEVDRALAVALTTKAERDVESQAVGSSTTALLSIRSQLDALRAGGADDTDPQVTQLTSQERTQEDQLSSARVRLAARTDDVRASVDEYHRFRDREESLNRSTAERIGAVDLRSMSDPSFFEAIWNWAGDALEGLVDFLEEFASDIAAMVDAALRGDWEEFFWRLNDVLHALVTIVGIALALLALIIPVGGLALAATVLGLVAFASSAGLAVAGTVNSETGRPMDWGTVAFEGIGLLAGFAIGGLVTRVGGTGGMSFSRVHQGTFLRRSVHGADGRFVTKGAATAFRTKELTSWVLGEVAGVPGELYDAQLEQSRGPFPMVRLAPPSSCSRGPRALLAPAA